MLKISKKRLFFIRNQIRGLKFKQQKDVGTILELLNRKVPSSETPIPSCGERKRPIDDTVVNVIGHVRSWNKEKNGTPRQPTVNPLSQAVIEIEPNPCSGINSEHLLQGLEQFSHIWIIFVFHKNDGPFTKAKVAPPRLGGGKRLGVLATRSPHRPNPIGLTLSKLERVEGNQIHVSGHDLLDGTPILDVKPYIPDYDDPLKRLPSQTDVVITTPDWVNNVKDNLRVRFTERALADLQDFTDDQLEPFQDWKGLRASIEGILQADPRSDFRRNKCHDKLYFFNVVSFHCTAWFDDDDVAEVLRVKFNPQEHSKTE